MVVNARFWVGQKLGSELEALAMLKNSKVMLGTNFPLRTVGSWFVQLFFGGFRTYPKWCENGFRPQLVKRQPDAASAARDHSSSDAARGVSEFQPNGRLRSLLWCQELRVAETVLMGAKEDFANMDV